MIVIAEFAAKSVHILWYPAIIIHDVGDNFWLKFISKKLAFSGETKEVYNIFYCYLLA